MITIDEIKRLDADRTQGEWFVKDWVRREGNPKYTKDYTAIIFEEKDGVRVERGWASLTDDYNGFYNRVDEALFVAAPKIVAKCIELDEVNCELVDTLKRLERYFSVSPDHLTILPHERVMLERIQQSLTKAGVL